MAKKKITQQLMTFGDVCTATGKKESDYEVLPELSNKQKAAICLDRVKLIAKAFNGDKKVRMADTKQWKYYPWYRLVPDESKLSGFGLSSRVYVCDFSTSSLGARPYFLKSEDATYAGKQFIAEFEAWAQYEDLSQQED